VNWKNLAEGQITLHDQKGGRWLGPIDGHDSCESFNEATKGGKMGVVQKALKDVRPGKEGQQGGSWETIRKNSKRGQLVGYTENHQYGEKEKN